MIKIFASALSLCLSLAGTAQTFGDSLFPSSGSDSGAVTIALTTDTGDLTDVAQQGFDIEESTDLSVTLTHVLVSPLASSVPQLASAIHIHNSPEDVADTLSKEYELFSAPIAIDDPFAVAALTWQSDSSFPHDATMEMRTLDDGQWSPWYSLDVADNCPSDAERCGSDYMVSGTSTGIQARISHTESPLPTDLRIDISYSTSGEENAIEEPELADVLPSVTSSAPQEPSSTVVLASSVRPFAEPTKTDGDEDTDTEQEKLDPPTVKVDLTQESLVKTKASIAPRSQWEPDESLRAWRPSYAKFEGVIIHHTAGSNSYTKAQVPSVIQGIYRYHAVTLEWGDIGYNVLIDKYGGRWEGRYGTLASPATQMVIGGHAKPRNTGTMGISVLGDYSNIEPSGTVLTSLAEVSAWKFIDANISPTSTSPLTIPIETSTMKSQMGKPLNRIVGHKDVYPTACPANIYGYLDQIRQGANSLYRHFSINTQIQKAQAKAASSEKTMFRLYNPISKEHLYTADANEVRVLTRGDWIYEGVAWVAPKKSSKPVYRLYNPYLGDHHYTTNKNEVKELTKKYDWVDEGIGWYSSIAAKKISVYRQYNPSLRTGAHHFTTDAHEYTVNNTRGWRGEGIAWYANKKGWQAE